MVNNMLKTMASLSQFLKWIHMKRAWDIAISRWRSLFWMTSNPLSWSLAAWEVWAWSRPRHFVRLGTEEGNRKESKVVWSLLEAMASIGLILIGHISDPRCRLTSEFIILMNESMVILSVLDFKSGVHQGGFDPTKSGRSPKDLGARSVLLCSRRGQVAAGDEVAHDLSWSHQFLYPLVN